jgi:hypothetical protein
MLVARILQERPEAIIARVPVQRSTTRVDLHFRFERVIAVRAELRAAHEQCSLSMTLLALAEAEAQPVDGALNECL